MSQQLRVIDTPGMLTSMNIFREKLPMDKNMEWKEIINKEKQKDYYQNLKQIIDQKYKTTTVYPPKEKIFNAFTQADSSVTRKYGGTGLGLNICAKLAALMKGKTYCISELGEGSSFFFEVTLPYGNKNEPTERIDEIAHHLMAQRVPHKILVAEDNQVNQMILCSMLKSFGYACDVAENGQVAVDKVLDSHGEYSLIFMDMQMPVMDGITASEQIIAHYGSKAPRIVACTANAFKSDKDKCLQAGMNGFLSKPIVIEELQSILLGK